MMGINQLSCHFCALSRDRTGTGLTPLVFETNASTNSAIRAFALCNAVWVLFVDFAIANLGNFIQSYKDTLKFESIYPILREIS